MQTQTLTPAHMSCHAKSSEIMLFYASQQVNNPASRYAYQFSFFLIIAFVVVDLDPASLFLLSFSHKIFD